MSKNDGGPAFPISNPDHQTFNPGTVSDLQRLMSGMSLRDYFAAKAMAAMIVARYDEHMRGFDGWREEFARESGRYADAMLAERAK